MSTPTRIEREHYQKLVGRQILAIYWDEMEGEALPILVLSGRDRDGHAATAAVLAIPHCSVTPCTMPPAVAPARTVRVTSVVPSRYCGVNTSIC